MPTPTLRKSLGFRDLLLFYIVTTFSLRWVAVAAAAGPSALVIWVIAALGLFVPLVFATIELSSRYPVQGGVYVWSREQFGPFAGFITGWLYWATNLPFFPSLLYFAAGNLLFVGGEHWQGLSSSSTYFIIFSMVGLGLTVLMNVVGLHVGKWLNNVGAASSWVVMAALIVAASLAFWRYGSATPMPAAAFVPGTTLKDIVFWSTIAFAFGGVESGSSMAEEIDDAPRTVPRAVLMAAVIAATLYLVGTLSVIVVVPAGQISGLQGITQALQVVTARAGMSWALPILALFVVVNSLGGVSGWFAAVARLPFVAGLDSYLPAAFGRVHPRWGSPYVALLTQAAVSAVFVILGQAGTSVRGAYDVLVGMSVITYFIPFLFMFAALIRVQREEAGPHVMRVPGGPIAATLLGALGFVTTSISIVLACIPSSDDPNPTLAIVKTVGLSLVLTIIGAIVYALGRRPQRDA